MKFLEKDLEEIIFTSSKEKLSERGLDVNGKLYRQVYLGNYGTCDLLSISRDYNQRTFPEKIEPVIQFELYELKQEKIGISAFLQAIGYMRGIISYLNKRELYLGVHFEFCITLIGKSIDTNSTFCYLTDVLPDTILTCRSFLNCYTYEYDIDGIRFNLEYDYNLTEKGF